MGARGRFVEQFAVLDYINGRREVLRREILSGGPRREVAREERAFLEAQHRVVLGGGSWRSRLKRLDPMFVEKVLAAARAPDTYPELEKPSYLTGCEAMGFRELLGFIDGALGALLRGDGGHDDGPRSEEEFLDLLGLLRAKSGEGARSEARPAPTPEPGTSGEFAPSEGLRALRDECDRLRAEVDGLRRDGGSRARSAGLQERRAERCRARADAWEAEERRERGFRRPARASGLWGDAPASAAPPDLSGTVRWVGREIERAFAPSGPLGPSGDLPWELLPPGSGGVRDGLLEHFERLARAYPEHGYMPERIEKARSLGPSKEWKGSKGFRGYVVFEFAGTERVLLECPVYGNAIYVLGGDWQRLSRKSKGAVMADDGTERIPHAGDWPGRAKRALGIR